jgi:hypothetical protein
MNKWRIIHSTGDFVFEWQLDGVLLELRIRTNDAVTFLLEMADSIQMWADEQERELAFIELVYGENKAGFDSLNWSMKMKEEASSKARYHALGVIIKSFYHHKSGDMTLPIKKFPEAWVKLWWIELPPWGSLDRAIFTDSGKAVIALCEEFYGGKI